MKKNKALRAAGILFAAAALTTCITAGTLARFSTTDTAKDSARVAKFGLTMTAGGSLFGSGYSADDNKPVFITDETDTATLTVLGSGGANAVAPGTQSDTGLELSISGTAEVEAELTGKITTESVFLAKGRYGIMQKKLDGSVNENNFASQNNKEQLYVRDDTGFKKAQRFNDEAVYYVLACSYDIENDYYPVVYAMSGTTAFDDGDIQTDSAKQLGAVIAGKFGFTGEAVQDTANKGKYTFDFSENGIALKANESAAEKLSLDEEHITWKWDYEKADGSTDNADSILGAVMSGSENLVAVKITDSANQPGIEDDETELIGEGSGIKIKLPEAGTDYSLTTGIELSISAVQID